MEKGKMEEKEGGGVEGGDEERKDGRRGGGGGEGRERGDGKEEGKGGGGRVGGKGGEVKMEVEEEKVEMFWRGNHPVLTRAKVLEVRFLSATRLLQRVKWKYL